MTLSTRGPISRLTAPIVKRKLKNLCASRGLLVGPGAATRPADRSSTPTEAEPRERAEHEEDKGQDLESGRTLTPTARPWRRAVRPGAACHAVRVARTTAGDPYGSVSQQSTSSGFWLRI
ncbi:hypothetical protein GCM10010151_44510 [Actinoallomurus spadix]|uniref:Uncharacterized protein n=1 Tax=Actinoallomurus spadix TaxID=79912 RepID=A0ABP3GPL2_9ACTN